MKKIIAIIMVFVMTAGFSVPALSADVSEAEKMLEIVKSRVDGTENFENFNSSYRTNASGKIYDFSWSSENKSLSVEINDKGVITSYSFYEREASSDVIRPTINKPSSDEMMKVAEEFVKKINPDIYKDIKIEKYSDFESLYGQFYDYKLTRVHNGIPVYGGSGSITLKNDGQVRNFSIRYDNLDFEEITPIDEFKAQNAFKEKIGLKLVYVAEYKDKKVVPALYYVLDEKSEQGYISAKDGEYVIPSVYKGSYDVFGDSMKNEAAGFTKVELAELENLKDLMEEEAAENVAKTEKYLNLEKFTLDASELRKGGENEYIYFLSFSNESGESAYVSLNAKNGKILSFSRYGEEEENTVSPEDNRKKQSEIAKYFVEAFGEYKQTEDGFVRFVNGIEFPHDRINVQLNMLTGDLKHFSFTYTDTQFADPKNAVSPNLVYKVAFDEGNYRLIYIPARSNDTLKYNDKGTLVYDFESFRNIDALTGEVKKTEEKAIPEYKDIKGHYAEKQINTLRKFSVGFEEENFRPDEEITQKDFVSLLVSCMVYSSPIILNKSFDASSYYQTAAGEKIIKTGEENPDGYVTREESAIFITRALRYEEIAQMEEIFISPFNDVERNKGYISILGGMGIFKGDENKNFNPNEKLTRADAMVLIYNCLSR